MTFTLIQGIAFLTVWTIICHALFYLCGYRSGIRRGIELAATPDIDFLRHIKLPTADEVKKQAEERFPL